MGNYTIFLDVRKSQERQASKKFYNKCSENSRSQMVFQTDIFGKLTPLPTGESDMTPASHSFRAPTEIQSSRLNKIILM